MASGGSMLRVAWLWTEMEGRRLEDGGGSVGPQGPLVEMMRGLRAKRWACYIWRSIVTSGKGRPGHLFTSSTLKYINKIYPAVSVTHFHTHIQRRHTYSTQMQKQVCVHRHKLTSERTDLLLVLLVTPVFKGTGTTQRFSSLNDLVLW